MSWYVAKLVFQIATTGERQVAQFDEHLRLICAESFEQAFVKARLLGIREEDAPASEINQASWEFVNISELYPLQDLSDGVELYSRIHETHEGHNYIALIHRKASHLAA